MENFPNNQEQQNAAESFKTLSSDIEDFSKFLQERENGRLNALISPEARKVLSEIMRDEDLFASEGQINKEKLIGWLGHFSVFIDGIGRAPRERTFIDNEESLRLLGQTLVSMNEPLAAIYCSLESQLSDDEKEKVAGLRAKTMGDLKSRTDYLGKRAKAVQEYLSNR